MADEEHVSDPRFTAEISNRMRVPDRIMVAGENQTRSITFVGVNGPSGMSSPWNQTETTQKFDMKVPDRILVAGGEQHIAAKSTPFEMNVENAILPPTKNQVRVNAPPRSIRLNEVHHFANNSIQVANDDSSDEDENVENEILYSSQPMSDQINRSTSSLKTPEREKNAGKHMIGSSSIESGSFNYGRPSSDPLISMMETIHRCGNSHNMNPWEEIQIVRRQISKLNHRLMAVELENQQLQQREMILTALVTCYFVSKFFMWLK